MTDATETIILNRWTDATFCAHGRTHETEVPPGIFLRRADGCVQRVGEGGAWLTLADGAETEAWSGLWGVSVAGSLYARDLTLSDAQRVRADATRAHGRATIVPC